MSVPDAAVSFLLDKLYQLLNYNFHLIADVRENIEILCQELENLKALMEDYSKHNHDSKFLKRLVKEIRNTVNQAEDAVDTYVVQTSIQKARSRTSQTLHMIDYPAKLRDVGKQIEEVGKKVKISMEKASTGYSALQHQAISDLFRVSKVKEAPNVEEEHVVGFEGATETVSKLLTGGTQQLEVISIVGMLGLGKTTLAKKVVKDPDVDYEFMIKAFVYVSKEYEKREVFLSILRSFPQISDEVNKMVEDQLEKHLYKQLEGKQYLIVLDDLWEKDDWDRLKKAFPNNSKRCRVLITTRNEIVAEYASRSTLPFKLDFLPLDKSRELLRWKVFYGKEFPQVLEEYEEKIAKKCDGLPLAIVVIAGILWNNRGATGWWKHVADGVKNYIARDEVQTTKVIELMYKHLPDYLKPCFIYLGVFREDFEIPVWKLLRLWIAEGFIPQEGDLNLEDIAEQHLEELVARNLVMVGQRRSNDRIRTCRIHDTLREFCKKEAVEEDLFHEIKKDTLAFFLSESPALDKCRRLCINNVNVLDYIAKPSGKHVRSFLTFAKEETTMEPSHVSVIPKSFKLLRVLEAQSLIFTRFPPDLCYLVLLKYVAISSNFFTLPLEMSKMYSMQTLIVNTTSPRLEIKSDIWKMPQMRHLHTNASTLLPCPDNKNQKSEEEALIVEHLQTLSTISPESCTEDVFKRTTKLKKLGIRGNITNLFVSRLFAYLSELKNFENLKLLNEISSPLYSLPSDCSFLQLTKLTLLNTLLCWKEMDKLGELKQLEVLKLKDNACKGRSWDAKKGGFRCLKFLHIGRTDLEDWEASVDHFPELKSLVLKHCDKLNPLPHNLADIRSLQMVVLHRTNPLVVSSARRLQVLKLEQAHKGNTTSGFKLSVYPPEN